MYRFKPINVRNDKNEIKKGINKSKKIKRRKKLINNLIMKCIPIFLS